MTELALRETDLNAVHEHALTVKQAGTNLLAIINDILDFSKIESEGIIIVNVDYELASLISDIVSIIRMKVLDTHLRLIINIDGNMPARMHGDVVKIRQALINVLGNAVKYTDKGFVSLTVYVEYIDDDTVNMIMEIEDSGKGIKPEDLEKLFIEFSQVNMEVNHDVEGIGLGLAITKNLMNSMGGSIKAYSEYGIVIMCTFVEKFMQ
jgi:signal transduction histidine kinase